jgi:hypothetical protein
MNNFMENKHRLYENNKYIYQMFEPSKVTSKLMIYQIISESIYNPFDLSVLIKK